jgi:hypothetical protein
MFISLAQPKSLLYSRAGKSEGAFALELSVSLNYLATGAVFAFLAAILLGAF